MRAYEFIVEDAQIDEAFPKWAKAAVMGAALGTAGAIATHNPAPTVDQSVTSPAQNVKKADPKVVDQMMNMLKTPEGKAAVDVARRAGMKGRELAAFLAQCSVESIDFTTMKEFGGSLDFKQYDIRFNPKKAKRLGNLKPGDGAKYIGRGLIQLTGRDNYARAGKALKLPLEEHPELVERPDVAAKVAVWYWKNRVHPHIQQYENTKHVTKFINSGLAKLEDRDSRYNAIAHILGVLNWPTKPKAEAA